MHRDVSSNYITCISHCPHGHHKTVVRVQLIPLPWGVDEVGAQSRLVVTGECRAFMVTVGHGVVGSWPGVGSCSGEWKA